MHEKTHFEYIFAHIFVFSANFAYFEKNGNRQTAVVSREVAQLQLFFQKYKLDIIPDILRVLMHLYDL